jgi:hypothetical protein
MRAGGDLVRGDARGLFGGQVAEEFVDGRQFARAESAGVCGDDLLGQGGAGAGHADDEDGAGSRGGGADAAGEGLGGVGLDEVVTPVDLGRVVVRGGDEFGGLVEVGEGLVVAFESVEQVAGLGVRAGEEFGGRVRLGGHRFFEVGVRVLGLVGPERGLGVGRGDGQGDLPPVDGGLGDGQRLVLVPGEREDVDERAGDHRVGGVAVVLGAGQFDGVLEVVDL